MTSVCVFGGASPNVDHEFLDMAFAIGALLAKNNINVVFGGGALGMMGALADGVLKHQGNITGVIPHFLLERETPHPGVANMRLVDSMHERKSIMYDMADIFLTLPGGFGTLEESLEVITWKQLSLHEKSIIVLDHAAFWCNLAATFDIMRDNAFLSSADRDAILFANTPEEALMLLKSTLAKP